MRENSPTEFKHWYWSNRKEIWEIPGLLQEGNLAENETLRLVGVLGTIDIINSFCDGLAHIQLVSRSPNVRILPHNFLEIMTNYFYVPFIWNAITREKLLEFDKKTAWHVPTHDRYRQITDRTDFAILKLTDHVAQEHFGVKIPHR